MMLLIVLVASRNIKHPGIKNFAVCFNKHRRFLRYTKIKCALAYLIAVRSKEIVDIFSNHETHFE